MQKPKTKIIHGRRGMVLMLSVIMMSMVLATSLGIFYLIYLGMKLAGTTRESQLAYYAADAGVECALYVDFSGANNFGTTTKPSVETECATFTPNFYNLRKLTDITVSWIDGARFSIDYPNGSCVDVTVDKTMTPKTKLYAVGKNTCSQAATDRVNRSLEVKY